MKKMVKKFSVATGENILKQPQILNDIKEYIGEDEYNLLTNNQGIWLEGMILFDIPTQVKVKYRDSIISPWNDLIGDVVFAFDNEIISEITTSKDVSGTIELTF